MNYPKSVYCSNEDITRKNMCYYDRLNDAMYAARKAKEKELGRRMTLRERCEFNKQFEENYKENGII